MASGIFVVAFDLWDDLGRRVSPMLAVYATASVAVTVAAGTRCAWYGLTGSLDAARTRDLLPHTVPEVTRRYGLYRYQSQPEAWNMTPCKIVLNGKMYSRCFFTHLCVSGAGTAAFPLAERVTSE